MDLVVPQDVSQPLISSSLAAQDTGRFGIRLAGRLIDMVFGYFVAMVGGAIGGVILAVLVGARVLGQDVFQRVQGTSMLHGMAWGIIASILYGSVCEGVAGTSVGKLVLGYRVVTDELRPCSFSGAVKRNVAYVLDSLFFGVPAYSAMSSSQLNQRYGDRWGHTVVVRAAALPATAKRSGGVIAVGLLGGSAAYALCILVSVLSLAF